MRDVARQFFVFAAVGVIGTTVHFAVLVFLVRGLEADEVLATSLGFVCGALTNYWLNYHFTFHSNKSHLDAGPKFLAVAAIGFILNAVLMLLSRALFAGQHYLLRQACTTIIVLVWNFAGNRFWSFRERSNEIDR